jgi:hypothetical protein
MVCLKKVDAGEPHSRTNGLYGRTKSLINSNYVLPLINDENGYDFRFIEKNNEQSSNAFIENINNYQKLEHLLRIKNAFILNPHISPENLEQFSKNIANYRTPIGDSFIFNVQPQLCKKINNSVNLKLNDCNLMNIFDATTTISVNNIQKGGLFNDFLQNEF